MEKRKGIALILAIGILALMTVIATSFALNMRLEYKAAVNYYNGVKARYLAEAAVERAIAELKAHVKLSAFDDTSEPWAGTGAYTNSNIAGNIEGSASSSTITIRDEQRKINVNNAGDRLLRNLFTELTVADPADLSSRIRGNKPGGAGYKDSRELMTIGGITEAEYAQIKDYVTIFSYVDPDTARSPVNINTCSDEVLRSVLTGLGDGSTTVSNGTAASVVSAITAARPVTSWSQFDLAVDNSTASVDEKKIIKDNCNPNRAGPSAFTTEFCFNSGGVYEVTAQGAVGPSGRETAARDVTAVVKIYDIYTETTKADFEQGVPERVTWFDSCPVESTDLFGASSIPAGAETVPGSLKIGFWDDFDEDAAYSQNEWTGPYTVGDADSDGDNEIYTTTTNWPTFTLQDAAKWTWLYHTIRVYEYDSLASSPASQMKDVGWVQCNGSSVLLTFSGPLEWGGTYYRDIDGACVFSTDTNYSLWLFPSGLRRFPDNGNVVSDYNTPHSHTAAKTFNITNSAAGASATVYNSAGSASIAFPQGAATTLSLYGQSQRPIWDDIRIIPPDGNFTSQVITPTAAAFDWGTITGTVTTPQSASDAGATVTATLETSTDGGNTWLPPAGEQIANTGGTMIQYKASLTTDDTQETPVLEDVTITYLPKTEILSWKID